VWVDVDEMDIEGLHKKINCCFSRWEARRFNMLGIIAAVLIVLWLLGFFAFHVTTGFIHIVLVVGLVLLVVHLVTGRSAMA
jgi:VIT1/CCC1 family predicted Fe2+/Mn2+ transporter